jgi:hypothetical protein
MQLRIARICPGGVSAHWRGVSCRGRGRLLSGTRERETGRMGNVVCGSVVLVRIKVGGSVVHGGGLMLMETKTSPGMGSGGGVM